MKDIGIVQGSKEQAQELVIGKDTVYVHTNIVKINEDSEGNLIDNLYQYHEIQYPLREYLQIILEEKQEEM